MVDRDEAESVTPESAITLLREAFASRGQLRAHFLVSALCAIALVVGSEAFAAAVRSMSQRLDSAAAARREALPPSS